MIILHVISPVHYGGGESLLVNLFKQKRDEISVEYVVTLYKSEEFSLKLQQVGVKEFNLSKVSLGDGVAKKKAFLHSLGQVGAMLKLYRTIKALNPDIVHVHSYPANLIIAFLKRIRLISCSIVYTRHSIFSKHSWVQRKVYLWMLTAFDVVTVVSRTLRGVVLDQYSSVRNIQVIHNCVSDEFFHVDEPLPKVDKRVVFLQVARFSPVKNHMLVIEAISKLPKTYRDRISVWFAGSGEMENEIKEKVEKLNLTKDEVTFLGFIPHEKMASLIAQADFGLFPSDNEGFGIGAVECMAAGRPVLSFDSKIMREITGGAGVLVSKDNLSSGFVRMLNDGNELRNVAREQALIYQVSTAKAKYTEIYQRTLAIRR